MLNKRRALRVSEAMDMAEGFIGEAVERLKCAEIVVIEAGKIAGIPHYLDECLIRLITDIERIDDVSNTIEAICESLADGAVKDDRKRRDSSSQPSLVA